VKATAPVLDEMAPRIGKELIEAMRKDANAK
jgi:hypothetical protein